MGLGSKKWSLVRKPTTNTLRQRAPYYTGWWWRGPTRPEHFSKLVFICIQLGFTNFSTELDKTEKGVSDNPR